jgi:hypothetical protein
MIQREHVLGLEEIVSWKSNQIEMLVLNCLHLKFFFSHFEYGSTFLCLSLYSLYLYLIIYQNYLEL